MKISNDPNATGPLRNVRQTKSILQSGRIQRSAARPPAGASSSEVRISSPGQLLSRAAKELEDQGHVRPDVVEAGREKLQNWNGLSEQQLDSIVEDLLLDFV